MRLKDCAQTTGVLKLTAMVRNKDGRLSQKPLQIRAVGPDRLGSTIAPLSSMSSGPVRSHTPNTVARWSRTLADGKAVSLIEAAGHAKIIGRPLNRFITIHLDLGDLNGRAQIAVSGFLRRAGQWLGDRSVPATYLWVLEHAAGTGLHVHILIHVPPTLIMPFSLKARHAWLKLSGLTPVANVIESERFGPRGFDQAKASARDRDSYQRQLTGVMRYHLKNLDPDSPLAATLGIDTESSTAIYGKRCGWSQNIGATARQRWRDNRQAPQPAHQRD